MGRVFRRIYNWVTTILIGVVVLGAILLVGVRLVGLTPYTVLSGSMEPTYHVGSMIYVQKTDPMALGKGDPVTYRMGDGNIVTHRIVEVVEDPVLGRCYRTKGDANNIEDNRLLSPDNVIGKPVFTIPFLGYISVYVQNPPGTYVAIAGCVSLLLLTVLADYLFPEQKEEETSGEEPGEETPTGETP